jgi:hypothetical protein
MTAAGVVCGAKIERGLIPRRPCDGDDHGEDWVLARSCPLRMSALRLLRALNRTSRGQPNSVENDPNGTFVTVRDPAFTGLRWAGQRKVAD